MRFPMVSTLSLRPWVRETGQPLAPPLPPCLEPESGGCLAALKMDQSGPSDNEHLYERRHISDDEQ
jgi:hypothetical protein